MKDSKVSVLRGKYSVFVESTSEKYHSLEKFNSVEQFLVWLFRGRCVICGEPYNVIHEINPRSSGQESMEWRNRITLCNDCHTEIHNKGTGEEQIRELQERRIEFLEMIGRFEYA